MKKIFLALVAMALFSGCDDGDMTFKTFDFSGSNAPASCPTDRGTIFIVNGSEVLLLKLQPSLLLNVPSPFANNVYTPTVVDVGPGSQNKMFYRTYGGTPNTSTFCSSSGTPNIVEEWAGNGTIEIVTTEKRVDGVLVGYQRQITVRSATFSNGDQEVTITDTYLGDYSEGLNYNFNFPAEVVSLCRENKLAYKTNNDQSLELYLENSDYLTGTTALPDINLNDDELDQEDENNLYFRKFNTAITQNNLCGEGPSGTVQTQFWRAISGTVKIVPTTDPENSTRTNYRIQLYNVVFANTAAPTELYRPVNTTGVDYYLMGTVNN